MLLYYWLHGLSFVKAVPLGPLSLSTGHIKIYKDSKPIQIAQLAYVNLYLQLKWHALSPFLKCSLWKCKSVIAFVVLLFKFSSKKNISNCIHIEFTSSVRT